MSNALHLRFKKLEGYSLNMARWSFGPFEGPETVKPPALPM
jgi:hypothetical protein